MKTNFSKHSFLAINNIQCTHVLCVFHQVDWKFLSMEGLLSFTRVHKNFWTMVWNLIFLYRPPHFYLSIYLSTKTGSSSFWTDRLSDDPWSDDPWSGDLRSGDPWFGDLRSGDPWFGDPWFGDPWSSFSMEPNPPPPFILLRLFSSFLWCSVILQINVGPNKRSHKLWNSLSFLVTNIFWFS